MSGNKNLYINVFAIIGLLTAGFVLYESRIPVSSNGYVWLEAEDADLIVKPLKTVVDANASGGRAVENTEIPSHQVEAYLQFQARIPQSGQYKFWARCQWTNECSNTFLLKINNYERLKFGEEPTFNKWFWVTSWKMFDLKHGIADVSVWNEESDTKIDRILLTTDVYYKPQGFGEACNYQIDFTDEQLPFKFANVKLWTIASDSISGNKYLFLRPFIRKRPEVAILPSRVTSKSFLYSIKLRSEKGGELLFNLSKAHAYKLQVGPGKSKLLKVYQGREQQLSAADEEISHEFATYDIVRYFPEILVRKNGKEIHRVTDSSFVSGDIGFSSSSGDFRVDDVNFNSDLDPIYNCTFWFHDLTRWPWDVMGDWKIERENIQYMKGRCLAGGSEAIYFIRKDYFRDYAVTCAIKCHKNEAGLVFYMKDTANYYLLKGECGGINKQQTFSLIKKVGGKEHILARKRIGFKRDRWNKVSIAVLHSNITCFLNNQLLFSARDDSFKEGEAGFWTNIREGYNTFDDMVLEPSSSFFKHRNVNRFEYNFITQLNIGLDFSDWNIMSEDMLASPNNHTIQSTKNAFENLYMENYRTFGSNIKVTHFKNIPSDIDEYFRLISVSPSGKELKCLLRNSKVILLVNKSPVLEVKMKQPRYQSTIVYHQDTVRLFVNEKRIFDYPLDMQTDSLKVGIGYSGPGKGTITGTGVVIENL